MKMVESIKLRRDLVDFVPSQGDVVVLKNIFGKIKKVALNNEYSNTQKHLHLLFGVLLQ